MKVLVSDKFKNSVPNEKRELVMKKIYELSSELNRLDRENKSIRNIKKGFSIWKIKNSKENIYKLRVDQSNRIIFTFTKYLKNWENDEYEDENNLHLLRYCTHDEQILKAKNINLDTLGYINVDDFSMYNDLEKILYDEEDENYNEYYNPVNDKVSIYSYEELEKIFGLNSRKEIYRLNEEQKKVLRTDCPVFLFGSAGSGKTTISVRKIINIYESNNDIKIGYFTLSSYLKDETKEIFKSFKNYRKVKTDSEVEFYSLEEFLIKSTRKENICKYNGFERWVEKNNIKKQMQIEDYDLFELYREIRGIIKGMIGIEWCKENPDLYKKVLMDKEEYLSLKPEYSSYKDKEKAYELARRYQNWIEQEKEIYDDNDLARECIEKIDNGEIEKFDFIIVDEIQDLTEKQIYMFYKLVKNSKNVFFVGDYNQTVNATYFNTHRIKSLFTVNEEEFNEYKLDLNYRSSKEIVKLAQRINELRIEKLYKDRKNDYKERYIKSKEIENYKPILLKRGKVNKEKVLSVADDRHYAAIVVPDEIEKKKLLKERNEDGKKSKIMTVAEIKGIEKDVVVCYNMISRNNDIWDEIVELNGEKEGFEKQFLYRPYFNKLYVAITRARKQVCFYEENDCKIFELLEKQVEKLNEFDENRLNLNVKSTSSNYINSGLNYEKASNYEEAIHEYEKSSSPNKDLYIKRCETYILRRENIIKNEYNKVFESIGNEFFNRGMFEDALNCYQESGNKILKIKCMIALKKDIDEIENIINKENIDIFDIVFNLKELDEEKNNKVILSFLDLCNEMIENKIDKKMDKLQRIENLFNL